MEPRTFKSVDDAVTALRDGPYQKLQRMPGVLGIEKFRRIFANDARLLRARLAYFAKDTGEVEVHPERFGFDVDGLGWSDAKQK